MRTQNFITKNEHLLRNIFGKNLKMVLSYHPGGPWITDHPKIQLEMNIFSSFCYQRKPSKCVGSVSWSGKLGRPIFHVPKWRGCMFLKRTEDIKPENNRSIIRWFRSDFDPKPPMCQALTKNVWPPPNGQSLSDVYM